MTQVKPARCTQQDVGPGFLTSQDVTLVHPAGLFNKPQKEYEVIVFSQRQANLKDDGSKGILVPTLSAAVTAKWGRKWKVTGAQKARQILGS